MSKNITIKTSEVKRLSMLQCTDEEIAAYFNISISKWRQIKSEDDAIREAIEGGQAQGKISLRRKQMTLAGVNATMAIHLGKHLLGQEDRSKLELSGPGGGPIETEYDYSKLSDDERAKIREGLTKAVRG